MNMPISFDENPTRQEILNLLKKNGSMTVGEMSRKMNITHMAVRQHLMYLERKGNVKYSVRKAGVGRPVFVYSLTEKAGERFPNAYGEFLGDVLEIVAEMEGKKKLEKIFKARNDRLLRRYGEALDAGETMPDKVALFAEQQNAMGAMVETRTEDGSIIYRVYNCLIQKVAETYPEVCEFDTQFYQGLFGSGVVRNTCQMQGAPYCEYIIPITNKR